MNTLDSASGDGRLNSFDGSIRSERLRQLSACEGESLPPQGGAFNMHAHSFFSFNGYGYSPSALAWEGRKRGLSAMGIVDFDVLDGVDEFLGACRLLNLRACAGIETRVFIPEFATRVINSPGEPGIAYHMGTGFTTGKGHDSPLLARLKEIAQQRNRSLISRVNPYLSPVEIDYARDLLPLSPNGNPTERHVCTAYDEKAREVFPDLAERSRFWAEKLGIAAAQAMTELEDPPVFQGRIRSKTMKAGGVGYVRPEGGDFPQLAEVNRFVREAGAIPTMAWLDGLSEGEQALDELLDVMIASGVAAVNIIPDRNWNIGNVEEKGRKVAELKRYIGAAQARHLPILIGTEMNAPGQRFVDDLDAPELAPHYEAFLEGVHILHAHTVLQEAGGMGYLSAWAEKHFGSAAEKNAYFAGLGERIAADAGVAVKLGDTMCPDRVRQWRECV